MGLAMVAMARPASAQLVQSFQIGVGSFMPRGFEGRDANDVLLRDFVGEPLAIDPTLTDAQVFDTSDFNGAHIFGEWDVALGDHLEFGAGLGYYGRTVNTFYRDLQDTTTGLDINQRLRLRVVPITALVRFLPIGHPGTLQPYVGAGISALNFRYSEFGDFVDPTNEDINSGDFVATGTTLGGVVLGGVRFPMSGDIYALSVEGRYQFGKGDTGGISNGFLADKIDLSGGELNVALLVRF
jgi:hypothetical protein